MGAENLKGSLALFRPLELHCVLGEAVERLSNSGKVLDKSPVVVGNPQKLLDFLLRRRRRPVGYLVCFRGVCPYTLSRDDVSEKGNFQRTEIILAGFELETSCSQSFEHRYQVLQMLLECLPHNDDVIQIHQTVRPLQSIFMSLWNVAGALERPKGMTLNSNKPSGVQNAVFSRSLGFTSTCQ